MKTLIINRKTTCLYLSIFFIICFSFYLAPNIMSVSPIYFTTLMGFITFFFALRYRRIPDKQVLIYLFHFLYGFTFFLNYLILKGRLHDVLVTIFFNFFYIFSDIVLYQVDNKKEISNIIKKYFILFVCYYIFDFVLRYKHSLTLETPDWIKANPFFKFYLYKDGGLNGDSNTIGNYCCVFFAFLYFCWKNKIVNKKYVVIAFVLTFFSFSRAAIIACITMFLFDNFHLIKHKYIQYIIIILGVLAGFIMFIVFLKDPSFKIHMEIFTNTFSYLARCKLRPFLFGVGPNKSINVLGRYAHNVICLLLIEYGIINFIIFFIMMIFTYKDVGKNAKYIYITYFITSLSYTTIFLQFLFVGLALTKHLSRILFVEEKKQIMNYYNPR